MNHLILAIALLSGTLVAQSANPSSLSPGSSPASGPSYSQQYCAGFVTHAAVPRTNYVLGSKESPNENSYPGRSLLFLGGPGLVAGIGIEYRRLVHGSPHQPHAGAVLEINGRIEDQSRHPSCWPSSTSSLQ